MLWPSKKEMGYGMEIRRIAVLGAGIMGGGIAQAAAQSGFEVLMEDITEDAVAAGLSQIKNRLESRVSQGKLDIREKEAILSNIETSARLEDCGSADLVIEAVVEKEGIKKEIFRKLDGICPAGTIFATNTSTIPITRLVAAVKRPERFIGMHFMNPAYVMRLVEIIKGAATSDEAVMAIKDVSGKMGKIPVVVRDSPGFVSNRVLMPMINEAIFSLRDGVSTKEGIDTIMKLGANHPMGPLELADFIGLDTCLQILEILETELGEKFRPCPLLREMVAAGKLGRKSGEGFYGYR
jgi:3-hydroxybutyryl-CoA dehydrogenase